MTIGANLAAALVAAQRDMPAVQADARNPHFNSEFVSLDHLLAETLPVLNKHGLALLQQPTLTDTGQPALATTLVHESGETLSSVMPIFMSKQDPQAQGSAITYARRYGLASVLAISDEKDDDGNAGNAAAASVQLATLAMLETELLEAADKLGAKDATREAVERHRGSPDNEGWLRRQLATANENLARRQAKESSAFKAPEGAAA